MAQYPLTNELVFINLMLIHESPNQRALPTEFIRKDGSHMDDRSELLNYLLKRDLIEAELGEPYYYLTELGYDAIEDGVWYDHDLVRKSSPPYIQDSYNTQQESPKRVIRPNLFVQGTILSILVSAGTYFIHGKLEKEEENTPAIQLINLDYIRWQIDSLHNLNKPSVYPIYQGDTIYIND